MKLALHKSGVTGSLKDTRFLTLPVQARFRPPLSLNRAKNQGKEPGKEQTCTKNGCWQHWRGLWWSGTCVNSSWCIMRECGLELLQFSWFWAAVRLYSALTQSNSSTARKILQADMQLSSRHNAFLVIQHRGSYLLW